MKAALIFMGTEMPMTASKKTAALLGNLSSFIAPGGSGLGGASF
jgi:hypothetical protein